VFRPELTDVILFIERRKKKLIVTCVLAGIECLLIDENATILEFKKDIRLNEIYYMLVNGLV
jgi:L-arabinose isomerase